MNIDISRIKDLKEELDSLNENDVLFINELGKAKYVIMPINMFDNIEDMVALLNNNFPQAEVKLSDPEDFELTYDEYERIKKQILDALEKTLMPKPEKLN